MRQVESAGRKRTDRPTGAPSSPSDRSNTMRGRIGSTSSSNTSSSTSSSSRTLPFAGAHTLLHSRNHSNDTSNGDGGDDDGNGNSNTSDIDSQRHHGHSHRSCHSLLQQCHPPQNRCLKATCFLFIAFIWTVNFMLSGQSIHQSTITTDSKLLSPNQPSSECYPKVRDDDMPIMTTDRSAEDKFQLKVPFYVYANELNWSNMTSCGVPIGQTDYPMTKHADDYWMYQSAMQHPMRTDDPEQAKLFFVPLYMNAIGRSISKTDYHLCIPSSDGKHTRCFDREHPGSLYRWVDTVLAESPYFQRSKGKDHVLVTSHYVLKRRSRQFISYGNLLRCNRVIFENFPQQPFWVPDRFEIPSLRNANHMGCTPVETKTSDFAMVASMLDRPTFKSRHNICRWLREDADQYSVGHCGEGDMCPVLATSKFGFHPRGDTLGSNRIMDTILSETIPLFTEQEQYDILPDFIPFREMSYYIDSYSYESFTKTMQKLSAVSQQEYDEKMAVLRKYKDRCNFMTGEPFDAYMTSFACKLGLQP